MCKSNDRKYKPLPSPWPRTITAFLTTMTQLCGDGGAVCVWEEGESGVIIIGVGVM